MGVHELWTTGSHLRDQVEQSAKIGKKGSENIDETVVVKQLVLSLSNKIKLM